MKIKQKLSVLIMGLTLFGAVATVLTPAPLAAKCGGVDTAIINCSQNNNSSDVQNNGVWGILEIVLNIMTAGVGIVAVGALVYAAILYTSAGDKAAQVQQAIGMITNTVIGLVAFALMWALLQYLIPGGVFS